MGIFRYWGSDTDVGSGLNEEKSFLSFWKWFLRERF